MTHEFDRVVKQLDLGTRTEHALRAECKIESMEELLEARSKLGYGQLKSISRYDQLRLYFVCEWCTEFGAGHGMYHFEDSKFQNYLDIKLMHLREGNIRTNESFDMPTPNPGAFPWDEGVTIAHALTSKHVAHYKCYVAWGDDVSSEDDTNV
jgi:hypothetical protein